MKRKLHNMMTGLRNKTVILVLGVLALTVAAFAAVSAYQSRTLKRIVGDTRVEQQQALSQISRETMHSVLTNTMMQTVSLQAKVANNDFAEVVNNVNMLKSMAEGIWRDRDSVRPTRIDPPDPAMDGKPSVMALCEAGAEIGKSEYLGIVGNLASPMLAMLVNSDKIDSCYIGLADGTHITAHDQTLAKLDENGRPLPFPVRQRPWYKGALQANGLYFTGLEADSFTGELMVTCSIPVKSDGKLIGVAGIDIVMQNMMDFINVSDSSSGSVFVLNGEGEVVVSSEKDGIFAPSGGSQAVDLRTLGYPELTAFVKQALTQETELELITLGDRQFYAAGAFMPAVGWAVVSVVEKELTDQPEKNLLSAYDQINDRASAEFQSSSASTEQTALLILAAVFLLSILAALYGSGRIVRPLREMTNTIIDSGRTGRLFEMKDSYRTGDEIQVLAESFDDLSKKTKKYIEDITDITKEKERVNTELNMANQIQISMLPHIFPAFPNRKEFDIYASMNPAKEVGGDFYDFFLLDEDHLCMVIADVSGKGVPAALFMMVTKAILKNNAMMGKPVGEILAMTNDTICSNNKMEMFVTVWIGILEISTGKITAANAGHEYPAICQDGAFSLLKDKHGFVIGGIEGMVYHEYEIRLKPGDRVFFYTDGVPEATDAENRMFGTDRMLEALNGEKDAPPEKVLENVKRAVDAFVNDAEQFDDLTMLCVEYQGPDAAENGEKR